MWKVLFQHFILLPSLTALGNVGNGIGFCDGCLMIDRPVIIVTHDVRVAERTDRIISLVDGMIEDS